VPPGLRQASTSLGLSKWAGLQLVELPLAAPSILAGIRTAAVINVGTATIAAFVGAGGYGERIVAGLAVHDSMLLLAGAAPAAVLAIVLEAAFHIAERHWFPGGTAYRT
jgi:osmoprotectant transport system permease protein